MDDRELTRLFRNATEDAPPASFDVDDVSAASRRATARHRMRVAAVTSITAIVLGGAGVVAVTSPFSDRGTGEVASAPAPLEARPNAGQPAQEDMRLEGGDSGESRSERSKQGGRDVTTQADKLGIAGTAWCDEVDRELATALAGELSVVPDNAVPGRLCSDGGNAAFRVTDGDATGLIMVAHLPGRSEVTMSLGEDTMVATARASSSGIVVVASVPTGGSATAPFAADVGRIADAIATTR
ncbi:hypothetical protein [Haloechinothrix salitolerans]|uniref:Uncharacterized protein n=1 Tax=Haloechinothrix salitolerans TaxID=926830 RepID=A0ABW2BTM3_9PSEU